MKLVYCGELERTPEAPDHLGIKQGLQWLEEEGTIDDWAIVDPVLNDWQEVVRLCNELQADLYIHGNTDSLNRPIIPNVKYGRQVFFMGDVQPRKEDYPFWDLWVKNSVGLSAIFISNRAQLPMWEESFKIPTFFWPHGCFVPDKLEYEDSCKIPTLFVGQMSDGGWYKNRFDLIKNIQKEVSITFINEDTVEGRNAVWRKLPVLYHSADTILDISHAWDIEGYASGRFWYSAGLGGCSVTKRFPGCEEFYEDKKEKWYFDTPFEAADIIRLLRKDENLRERTKLNAYERNKKDHNYKVRFNQLFSCVGII